VPSPPSQSSQLPSAGGCHDVRRPTCALHDEAAYRRHFGNPAFGLDAARAIGAALGRVQEPERTMTGTSLAVALPIIARRAFPILAA